MSTKPPKIPNTTKLEEEENQLRILVDQFRLQNKILEIIRYNLQARKKFLSAQGKKHKLQNNKSSLLNKKYRSRLQKSKFEQYKEGE